ncbi:hypothetical protein C8R44DRAFT_768109 [Mycena epipterygia]|nr:hypothetical protein C8R44DRAFT_768109 [Mycena epipterygia]
MDAGRYLCKWIPALGVCWRRRIAIRGPRHTSDQRQGGHSSLRWIQQSRYLFKSQVV